ncbi:MAG: nucleic acid-binding protein [Spirochaetales bacterium]|nr:nucleic acid-binding protein [Spirochaetales bacterium]
MENIFDNLKELQEILQRKYQLLSEKKEIPKSLATKKEMVARLKKNYIDKNGHAEKKEGKLNRLKEKLAEIETQREEYEKSMEIAESQREYEILDKQIKDTNDKEQNLRKSIRKEEMELDELRETIRRSEFLIKEQEEELNLEKSKIDELLDVRNAELEELKQKEDKITPTLTPDIIFKFDRIVKNKEGLGIVSLKNNVCNGCYMTLSASFVNDVRREKEIKFCPYCSRVLQYKDEQNIATEDYAFDEEEAGGLADLVKMDDFDI